MRLNKGDEVAAVAVFRMGLADGAVLPQSEMTNPVPGPGSHGAARVTTGSTRATP